MSGGEGVRTWLQANGWESASPTETALLEEIERLRAEIERLRALVDSVLACDGSDRTTHVTVEIPFDLYHALEEARHDQRSTGDMGMPQV